MMSTDKFLSILLEVELAGMCAWLVHYTVFVFE